MVKNPVCGMDIEEESAAGTYKYSGQTYDFCHPSGLEKFRAAMTFRSVSVISNALRLRKLAL